MLHVSQCWIIGFVSSKAISHYWIVSNELRTLPPHNILILFEILDGAKRAITKLNSSIATRRWFGTAIYLQFGRRMHRMFDAMHGGHVTFKVTHYLWIILFWESKCLTACNFSAPSDALLMPVSSAVRCTVYMSIEYVSHSFSVSLSLYRCICMYLNSASSKNGKKKFFCSYGCHIFKRVCLDERIRVYKLLCLYI